MGPANLREFHSATLPLRGCQLVALFLRGFTIAATEDRPSSVPADRWVLLAPNLGMVVVPSRTEITGYVEIDGNRMPVLNTTLGSGYFMFRGSRGWERLHIRTK